MTPLHALARRLWPLVDWRRHAVLEARGRRGAAAMLDESMRRTVATLTISNETEREREIRLVDTGRRRSQEILRRTAYCLGDSDGTRVHEPENIPCGPACDIHTVRPGSSQCNSTDPACPNSDQFPPPTTRTVDRQTLLRRAREASQGGADYLPPWTGEGL